MSKLKSVALSVYQSAKSGSFKTLTLSGTTVLAILLYALIDLWIFQASEIAISEDEKLGIVAFFAALIQNVTDFIEKKIKGE
jgi:hypothetical protein